MQISDFRDTIKIRDRGQVTLPEELRLTFPWLQAGSIVEIVGDSKGQKVVMKPVARYDVERGEVYKQQMKMSWDTIEKNLAKISRSGDPKARLSEFIVKDRDKRKYQI